MEKEHVSVKTMWENYLKSLGENIENTDKSYTSWYFSSNKENANNLAKLVKQGDKRGTTSLFYWYEVEKEEFPKVGNHSVITNWNGIAECIIRTKKVTILPFKDVNNELAEIEGEGDKSLEFWQRVHIEFFSMESKELGQEFTPETLVVFEEFEVVYM